MFGPLPGPIQDVDGFFKEAERIAERNMKYRYKHVDVTPQTADDIVTHYLEDGWKLLVLYSYVAILEKESE